MESASSFVILCISVVMSVVAVMGYYHTYEILNSVGKDKLPYRKVSWREKSKWYYFVPVLNFIMATKNYPETYLSKKDLFSYNKDLVRKTGMLFPKPEENIDIKEETLFYLKQFSQFSNLLWSPRLHARQSDLNVSKSKNLVTFSVDDTETKYLFNKIPAATLTLTEEKYVTSTFSMSYLDYERIYESSGYKKLCKLSKQISELTEIIKLNKENEKYDELLGKYHETIKKVYEAIEQSLVVNGEVSENIYDKSNALLERFTKEAVELNNNVAKGESQFNETLEIQLAQSLDNELEFQERYAIAK